MREKFLSLDDISKQTPGFKFFTKDGSKFELLSVEKRDIHVAHGILGDKYQQMIIIKAIDKDGKIYTQNNLTNELNGGNIYTIAYIEQKGWYEFRFLTKDPIKEETERIRRKYRKYLEDCVKQGKITELEMYKIIEQDTIINI
jgi:hypothetical protein